MEYYYILGKTNIIWKSDEITNEIISDKEFLRRKIWRKKKDNYCNINDNSEIIDKDEFIKREIVRIMFDKKRKYKNVENLKNVYNINYHLNSIINFFKTANKLCSLFMFSIDIEDKELYNYCKNIIKILNDRNKLDSEITLELTYIIKNIMSRLLYIKDKNVDLSNNVYNVYVLFNISLRKYGYKDNVFYSNEHINKFKKDVNECVIYIKNNLNFEY